MLEERLKYDVEALYLIGPRNIDHYENLCKAEDFIIQAFTSNFSPIKLHEYNSEGKKFHNIIAEFTGESKSNEVLIVGAHYDTKDTNSSGENASALAILLELARHFSCLKMQRSLRIVAFANEEKPFNEKTQSGSITYAKYCRDQDEKIIGMICLQTLGSKSLNNLSLKNLIYSESNMGIEAVTNKKSKNFLNKILPTLKEKINVDTSMVPDSVEDLADQWGFWQENYPAILLKDNSTLGNMNTPDELNYDWLSVVCKAIKSALEDVLIEQ